MKAVNEKFSKTLRLHKSLVSTLAITQDIGLLVPIKKTGEELALVYADFKCQNKACQCTTDLQFHHLISMFYKYYIDKWKFEAQRNYWANILILCKKCHSIVEFHGPSTIKSGTISQKKIDKIKKKYSDR